MTQSLEIGWLGQPHDRDGPVTGTIWITLDIPDNTRILVGLIVILGERGDSPC